MILNLSNFEFGLENGGNIKHATKALEKSGIKYDVTSGGGFTYFVFSSHRDYKDAVDIVEQVINKSVEEEW